MILGDLVGPHWGEGPILHIKNFKKNYSQILKCYNTMYINLIEIKTSICSVVLICPSTQRIKTGEQTEVQILIRYLDWPLDNYLREVYTCMCMNAQDHLENCSTLKYVIWLWNQPRYKMGSMFNIKLTGEKIDDLSMQDLFY